MEVRKRQPSTKRAHRAPVADLSTAPSPKRPRVGSANERLAGMQRSCDGISLGFRVMLNLKMQSASLAFQCHCALAVVCWPGTLPADALQEWRLEVHEAKTFSEPCGPCLHLHTMVLWVGGRKGRLVGLTKGRMQHPFGNPPVGQINGNRNQNQFRT